MNVYLSDQYQQQISRIAQTIPQMRKSILVTGATGMIGSSIIDILLCANQKYENQISVFALGRDRGKLEERFSYVTNIHSLKFIVQDVMEPLDEDIEIDYIVHAASNADPISYAKQPTETLLTNIYGTNNVLTYCRNHLKTRLLLTSTFEAYGKIAGKEIFTEIDSGEVDLNQIRSCYPESKRAAEILLRCYHQQYEVDGVIARLCSIYGPTMGKNDSKAHAQFIRNGLQGKNIVLKSRGLQKRTYCYLMDTISGIFTILLKGESGEAYNIANEESVITIADLARIVASVCGTSVVYEAPDAIEQKGYSRPQNCILDNAKLRSLGWESQYSLEEGIKATIGVLRETTEQTN